MGFIAQFTNTRWEEQEQDLTPAKENSQLLIISYTIALL